MNRVLRMLAATAIVWSALPIAANAQTAPAFPAEANGLTIDFPRCARDLKAWRSFSPGKLGTDSRLLNEPAIKKRIAEYDAIWRRQDAVDLTWLDIDGDGWCDVITSGEKENYKNVTGKPVLLLQPRGIYIWTERGFKPFKPGMSSGEYEGSSFTVYWNARMRAAALYSRIWQGNLIGGLGPQAHAFHLRQMLRASFAALKAGNAEEEELYLAEVNPLLYTEQIPPSEAMRIWSEEARRTGVASEYPYLHR